MSIVLAAMLLADLPASEVDAFALPPVSTFVALDEALETAMPAPLQAPAAPQDGPPSPAGQLPPDLASTAPIAEQEIVVVGRADSAVDPLVGINAPSFRVSQAVDKALIGPIAEGYVQAIPKPVRNGIRNFLSNLYEPVIFLNYLLQAKPGKAAETLGRFAINSTLGVAGLFDAAKKRPFNLPFRPNGFANTFGIYGIKPGPYLFLPIIGATTPRDLVGLFLDRLVLPVAVGSPFNKPAYTIPTGLLHTITRRVAFDNDLRRVQTTSDPYVARRDLYLKSRQAEIDRIRGRPVAPDAPPPSTVR